MTSRNKNTMNDTNMVLVARVTSAHGIRGLVKVQSFTSIPEDFANYSPLFDENGKEVDIKISGEAKGMFLAQVNGITTRNDAEDIKGLSIYANRDSLGDLEDGEFFLNDIVDLDIADSEGKIYGTVEKVVNYGSCDLLQVKSKSNKTFLVPMIEEHVELIDFDNNKVIVHGVKQLMELGGIKDDI